MQSTSVVAGRSIRSSDDAFMSHSCLSCVGKIPQAGRAAVAASVALCFMATLTEPSDKRNAPIGPAQRVSQA
jgi:hypothetical protein